MTEALVLAALREAIRWRQPKPGLIHHTDRGGQYAGGEYRQVLRRARMEQSMSRPDNCYDNAFYGVLFRQTENRVKDGGLCGRARRPRGDPRLPVLLRHEAASFVLELLDSVR